MKDTSLATVTTETSDIDALVNAAMSWLDEHQQPEGYWVGLLQSNSCMEAEWLMALHFLGVHDPKRCEPLKRAVLNEQREDGAWETYYQAPSGDINVTVECYAALRCAGMSADDPSLVKAREWILSHGGLAAVRVFTRYWLALIGEWPWEQTPNVPPEIILLPKWFPFNVYNFAAWARATMLPISVLSARRATRPLHPDSRLDELFPGGREDFDYRLPRQESALWRQTFLRMDRALHYYQKLRVTPGRGAAIRLVLEWIVKHQDADGAWGGIQPPWIYSLLALHAEGYALEHPVVARGLAALDSHWSYERDGGLYVQASESPVWDTLLALLALLDCGQQPRERGSMRAAVEWTLGQQVRVPGDWRQRVPRIEPGGWAFERANTFYPDVDDTAVALIVLARLRDCFEDTSRLELVIDRALEWLLAMQSSNGGWAAFDKDNDKAILTKLPFCDFGEVLDPPSVDVTAHVVEALGLLGMDGSHPAVARALEFIYREQEPEGSWFGRWGVNHIYGTAAVLPALAVIGEDMRAPRVQRAADWIAAHQNPDGGWGETCASYMDDKLRGKGDSTPSQTGWALMALIATDDPRHRPAILRGVGFLSERQRDGTWEEPQYTGAGFPGYGIGARVDLNESDLRLNQGIELGRGFMINYNLYRHYFPLMALGRARSYLQRHG